LYITLTEFGTPLKLARLIKMYLHETNSKYRIRKDFLFRTI
jgi:hypothetical protein